MKLLLEVRQTTYQAPPGGIWPTNQLSYHAGLHGANEATLGILCRVLETPVHEVCGETGEAPREDYHSGWGPGAHVL